MRLLVPLLASLVLAGCAAGARAPGGPGSEPEVDEKVVVEQLPDGRVRKTTIRTVRKKVPAPAPPPRPADPWPADPLVRYNVDRINAYRAQKGLPALLFDAKISSFARAGSEQLASDHKPHAHFMVGTQGVPGFGSRSAENQGDPGGVPSLDPDPKKNGKKQVDVMLQMMMAEGPGGGHHDNMMNPRFRRVGVGIVYVGGKMYLTNDFSD